MPLRGRISEIVYIIYLNIIYYFRNYQLVISLRLFDFRLFVNTLFLIISFNYSASLPEFFLPVNYLFQIISFFFCLHCSRAFCYNGIDTLMPKHDQKKKGLSRKKFLIKHKRRAPPRMVGLENLEF